MARALRTRLTPGEGRAFAFPVGGAFLALAAILVWRQQATAAIVCGGLGGTLLALGLAIPSRLGPLYRGWMRFALVLSKVTTPIFMGVVFFLVITPTGIVMRLLGKDPLRRDDSEADGFWVRRPPAERRSDLERQF